MLVPWQSAVYTRPAKGRVFTFSHIEETEIAKDFPASLKVSELAKITETNHKNVQILRRAPLLILVTGTFAQEITYKSYSDSHGDMARIELTQYDHLQRLAKKNPGEFEELDKAYRALQCHSTLTSYSRGDNHEWAFESSVPMLSSIVVLPKMLTECKLKIAMGGFQRALKKSLRDSLIFIGDTQFKEETWERKREPQPFPVFSPFPAPDCPMVDDEK